MRASYRAALFAGCISTLLKISNAFCEWGACEDEGERHFPDHVSTNFLHFDEMATTYEMNEEFAPSHSALKQMAEESQYRNVIGISPLDTAAKLNSFAAKHTSVASIVNCSDLDPQQVADLALELKPYVDEGVAFMYTAADLRQMHMKPGHLDSAQLNSKSYRDMLCAETMKLWAHHIPPVMKTTALNLVLPSLPDITGEDSETQNWLTAIASGHDIMTPERTQRRSGDTQEVELPHWPSVVHFLARGHGPYPFWQFGSRNGISLMERMHTSSLYDPGASLEVWHSVPEQATKVYHSKCQWQWLVSDIYGTQPCIALQPHQPEANGTWFLYTARRSTKSSDGSFCCKSSSNSMNGIRLATMTSTFVDSMKYVGEVDFHGDFYDGVAKRYVVALNVSSELEGSLPVNVWYETDLDGRPLRFAQLSRDMILGGHSDNLNLPLLYEEIEPQSFTDGAQTFSESVFDLPEVCRTQVSECIPAN